MPDDGTLLDGMANFHKIVSVYTAMRQQFIDAGWSPQGAEEIVLHLAKQNQAA